MFLFSLCYSSSGASVVAIDNKIEQAMVSSSATLDVANVSVSLKKKIPNTILCGLTVIKSDPIV